MSGEVPNPIKVPDGCRFHLNCPSCMDRCKNEEPVLKEIGPGHMLACHLAN
ncbi:MAG: hypothetical protein FWH01_09040 [Oscillospiraceae bacterium]|nr:hypothetical protein [Oscillospiraceae bacterium]